MKRNSINQIIEVLKHEPGLTENEIMWKTFNYKRRTSKNSYNYTESNKKYAEMLRRGLRNGKVERVKAVTSRGVRFVYYIPGCPVSCDNNVNNVIKI